jgi:hypothetical protein
MSVRRYVLCLLIVAGALACGAPAVAQFPKIPKVPKVPKLPTPPSAPTLDQPAEKARPKYCASITDDQVDRFLKALKVEQNALADNLAAANARKASADAAANKRSMAGVEAMMKVSECKDAAIEKDPRTKERDRLYELAESASAKGDEKASEKFASQASALRDRIEADAEKVCGSELSAIAAAGQPTAEESAASRAAAEAMSNTHTDAMKAGAKAGDMTEEEYARLKECVRGHLLNPQATPTTPESDAAIDKRSAELKPALEIK